jgi:hypothetical protein
MGRWRCWRITTGLSFSEQAIRTPCSHILRGDMAQSENAKKATQVLLELVSLFRGLSDSEVGDVLNESNLRLLLESILNPQQVHLYPNIAEFFLAHKIGMQRIAWIRDTIIQSYSIEGTKDNGIKGYVSPHGAQWFEEGVMFLEGPKPLEGFLGAYQNGKMSYAVAARDTQPGEQLGREHFNFVDMEDFEKILQLQITPEKITNLQEPLLRLNALLESHEKEEVNYQELLIAYPWILGAQYKTIQRHEKLDDQNIPDFTGVRVHDDNRDVFEIESPFKQVFRRDGRFTQEFNEAWNQAEQYLDFATQNQDYLLRQKGLRFNNPKCYLIIGYNLTEIEISKLRRKERNYPAIRIYTYNELAKFISSTINFVARLKNLGLEQASHT